MKFSAILIAALVVLLATSAFSSDPLFDAAVNYGAGAYPNSVF